MTQSASGKGLKANKAQAKAPSAVEVIFSDSDKLNMSPIIENLGVAYQFGIDHEKLSLTKGEHEAASAAAYVGYIKAHDMDYPQFQAFKKHVINAVAIGKKQAPETVENWLNKIVKSYMSLADLGGWVLPKSTKANSVAKSKARAELAALSDDDLITAAANCAAEGTADGFKQAAKYTTEIKRRADKANNADKAKEKSELTAYRKALKDWVGKLDADQCAVLAYVKNNFDTIRKQAKLTK